MNFQYPLKNNCFCLSLVILFLFSNYLIGQSFDGVGSKYYISKPAIKKSFELYNNCELSIRNEYFNLNSQEQFDLQVGLKFDHFKGSDIVDNEWEFLINYDVLNLNTGLFIAENIDLVIKVGNAETILESLNNYENIDASEYKVIINSFVEENGTNASSFCPEEIELYAKFVGETINTSTQTNQILSSYSIIEDDILSQLHIQWEQLKNAVEYHLEYAYFDLQEYEENNPPNISTSEFQKEFEAQKVIVTTNENSYTLETNYPEGWISYRVIPLFNKNSFNKFFIDRDNSRASAFELIEIVDGDNPDKIKAFEQDKNWSYSTSFAEDGKYIKQLSYFDNFLRNQQSLQTLKSENLTLVSESDFDLEGRPTVKIIPVPDVKPGLKFRESFNRADGESDAYSFLNHEKYVIEELSTESGAAKYYSSSNSQNGLYDEFLPDMNQMPIVQSEFKRDNTSRLMRSGGVGPEFQLNSNHHTKYFYTTPSITKLYQLFGDDIGKASHYKKTITVDPNGQASASYADMQGNVIATSLVGNSPNNVISLESNSNISTGQPFSFETQNGNYTSNISQSTNIVFLSSVNQTVDVEYTVDPHTIDFEEVCYACEYELQVEIRDPCGELVPVSMNGSGEIDFNAFSADCDNNDDFNLNFSFQSNEIGEYKIFKQLVAVPISFSTLESTLETTTYEEIFEDVFMEVDFLSCIPSCEQCEEAIIGIYGDVLTQTELDEIISECIESCDLLGSDIEEVINTSFTNMCDGSLPRMEAQISEDFIKFCSPGNPLSFSEIFNCVTDNGPSFPIEEVSGHRYIAEFVDNNAWVFTDESSGQEFDDIDVDVLDDSDQIVSLSLPTDFELLFSNSWQLDFASAFLPCHREYCHSQICECQVNSNVYNTQLLFLEDLNEAISFFNLPSGSTIQQLLDAILLIDPFANIGTCLEEWTGDNPNASNDLNDKFNNFEDKLNDPISGVNNFATFIEWAIDGGIDRLEASFDNNEWIDSEPVWKFIVSTYLAFKVELIDNYTEGSDCDYIDDEDAIYVQPLLDEDYTEEDYLQIYEDIINQNDNSDYLSTIDLLPDCDDRVAVWMEIFDENYPDAPDSERDDIEALLGEHCHINCMPDLGSQYITQLPVNDFNILDCFSGLNGEEIFNLATTHTDRLWDVATGPFTLTSIHDFPTIDGIVPDVECVDDQDIFFERYFWYYPEAELSDVLHNIIIHSHNENGNNINENFGVVLYRLEDPAENCNETTLNFNGAFCSANKNIYNDINYRFSSSYTPFLVRVFSTNQDYDINSAELTMEIIQNFDNQKSDYYYHEAPFENYKALLPLSDIGSYGPNNEYEDFVNDVWNCEANCGDIDPCMEEIIDAISDRLKDNLSLFGVSWSTNVFHSTTACDFRYRTVIEYDDEIDKLVASYIVEECALFGNEPVVIEFVTEDGHYNPISHDKCMSPPCNNCKEVEIIDYHVTNKSIDFIDERMLVGGKFEPGIEFLLNIQSYECDNVSDDRDNHYIRAYMTIEGRDGILSDIPDLTTNCDIELPDDSWEDCFVQIHNDVTTIATERYNNVINEKINEFYQSYECTDFNDDDEMLNLTYSDLEHHYTLYYYDQVGNLVKTVPPAGVVLGDDVNPPNHQKITTYTYNSYNQIVSQTTPDAGTTNFIYDDVQRMRFSQNAKQADVGDETDNDLEYSYTIYDDLSRVIEVGEADLSIPAFNDLQMFADQSNFPIDDPAINKEEITKTFYTETDLSNGFDHGVARGRIILTQRLDQYGTTPQAQTFYNYDVHGNVKQLRTAIEGLTSAIDIFYDYDLISGNVHEVAYNPGYADQYFHKYLYDADNRLSQTFTSLDNYLWDEDAKYYYYAHGPLARVELGHDKIQGSDYIYTKQGWIKSNNLALAIDNHFEPGQDGVTDITVTNSVNQFIPRDEMSYTLAYYNGDYKPTFSVSNEIDVALASIWDDENGGIASSLLGDYEGLYNGNISVMSNAIPSLANTSNGQLLTKAYTYDQLHRIKESFTYLHNGTEWNEVNQYRSDYTYDPDGNLKKLKRRRDNGLLVNRLNYTYPSGVSPDQPNALIGVVDDFNNIPNANYTYDKIGNLVESNQGDLTNLVWDVYGKVKNISTTGSNPENVEFTYDASGNRVRKKTNQKDQFYIRDASGNIMSIYEQEDINGSIVTTQIEAPIYGSKRLGQHNLSRVLNDPNINLNFGQRTRSKKSYELSNHLGNVLAVVSDRKLGVDINDDNIADRYNAEVIRAQDYYPFGMEMPGRSFVNSDFSNYRYGFNGKEKDEDGEWGDLTHYDYGFRIYNPGIAKFLSVDPLTKSYPWYTPYQFAGNMPIWAIDVDGLEPHKVTGDDGHVEDGSSIEEDYVPTIRSSRDVPSIERIAQSAVSSQDNVGASSDSKFGRISEQRSENPNDYWRIGTMYNTSREIYSWVDGSNSQLEKDIYGQKYGEEHAIGLMQHSVMSAISRFNATALTVTSALLLAAETGGIGLSMSRLTTVSTGARVSVYNGVRGASAYLQRVGVPRVYRKQILESFEISTISLQRAGYNTFGLRFFGGLANVRGRYLFPTFTNYTNRVGLALPRKWNSMSGFTQFQIRPGSTYIFGRAASQGGRFKGGSYQIYINNLGNLIR